MKTLPILALVLITGGCAVGPESSLVKVEKYYTQECPPAAAQTADNGAVNSGCTLTANSATEADSGIEGSLSANLP